MQYKALVQSLLTQAFASLQAQDIVVRCRAADSGLVKGMLGAAAGDAAKRYFGGKACSATLDVAAPLADEEIGGVWATASGGKVVCMNSLEARLAGAIDADSPVIRQLLFGEKPRTHTPI